MPSTCLPAPVHRGVAEAREQRRHHLHQSQGAAPRSRHQCRRGAPVVTQKAMPQLHKVVVGRNMTSPMLYKLMHLWSMHIFVARAHTFVARDA